MTVTFGNIVIGEKYSRPELAEIWGYRAYQALARGVVTPKGSNFIILFVTEEKQDFQEQYQDHLDGDTLNWEGPTDHFAEERIISTNNSLDEIHLFYRRRHHDKFTYLGQVSVEDYQLYSNRPSKFVFKIM